MSRYSWRLPLWSACRGSSASSPGSSEHDRCPGRERRSWRKTANSIDQRKRSHGLGHRLSRPTPGRFLPSRALHDQNHVGERQSAEGSDRLVSGSRWGNFPEGRRPFRCIQARTGKGVAFWTDQTIPHAVLGETIADAGDRVHRRSPNAPKRPHRRTMGRRGSGRSAVPQENQASYRKRPSSLRCRVAQRHSVLKRWGQRIARGFPPPGQKWRRCKGPLSPRITRPFQPSGPGA